MNINKQINLSTMLNGKENYKIGFVFLVGYLLTYFSKMQSYKVDKRTSFAILFGLAIACSLFY